MNMTPEPPAPVLANQADLFEAFSDQVLVFDAGGRIQYANAAARSAFAGEESPDPDAPLAGQSIAEVCRRLGLSEAFSAAHARALNGESAVAEIILRIEGRHRPTEFIFNPLPREGEVQQVVAVGRDAERRAKAELQRERLFALVENSSDFIGMADAQAKPFYVNPAGRRMVGLNRAEIPETAIADYYPADQLALVKKQLMPKMRADGYWSGETWFRHFGTGARIPVSDTHFAVRNPQSGALIGYGTITRDISERKRTEEALREAVERLRDADRRKDEFIAMLAHELRNPLAPLRTGLDLLQRAPDNAELRDRIVPMMERQLAHLLRLIDDLLDVSRVSRGRVELQRDTLDLNAPVQAAIEQVRPLIDRREHRLHLALCRDPLPVHGDFERLTQVVANLLDNAAKYTPPGGTLHVVTGSEGDQAQVSVRDSGLGITADALIEVFELFSQVAEHQSSHDAGGLGVGLALSRTLVEMHGGTIEARSEGVGHGSAFTVRLPLSPLGQEETPADMRGELQDDPPRRVLVVDDNVDAAEGLRMLLELKGHAVEAVHGGRAALEAVERFQPEVVLLDLGLPDMDGLEVAKQIRSKPSGDAIRLVAVTGWGQDQDRVRTKEAGFEDHLTKPVELDDLRPLLVGPDQR